ncbi:MAG: M20/M25/M40 family metallo-hydrolase [Proteobacteria bacterium]|nr:M20/M25/M40 family metallo-hydrolase [Pseudomonadota bacterium]
MIKRTLVLAGSVIVLLSVVVVVRTLMHRPIEQKVLQQVEIELDENLVAQHLSEAIQIATVTHQNLKDRDQQAFEDFISWVAATYPELHATLSLQRLNDTLLYKWQGKDETLQPILLTGHYDVVPVIPGSEDNWQYPPFSGAVVDGVIWGRGALDDKSGVIGILEAANHLVREGFEPMRTVYLSFGHDEEAGGPNGAALVAETLKKERVQLAWSLDEGSFVFNKMIAGVGPLMAVINVAEKGSVTLQIVARSTGGHSSMPPRQTAVGILAEAIIKLEKNPMPGGLEGLSLQMFDTISRYMPFVPRVFFANRWLFAGVLDDQLSAQGMTNAMLRTTTAPTMLSASVKINVLPVEAIAGVNFRVHPRDSVEDVISHVKRIVESDKVEVRLPAGSGRAASGVSDWNSKGYSVIADSVRQVYGEIVISPGLMIAASDSRHYAKVADNSYRFNPLTVTSEDLTGFHGTNEKISVDNLARGIRTYIQIIRNGASE